MSVHAGWIWTIVFGTAWIMWSAARWQWYRWQLEDIKNWFTEPAPVPADWGSARVDEDTRLQDTTTTIRKLAALADPCPDCQGNHEGTCGDEPIEGIVVDRVPDDDSQWRWDDTTGMWLPPRELAEADWYNHGLAELTAAVA